MSICLLFSSIGLSQGIRFSSTVTQQGTIGTATNAVVLPAGAVIAFCNHPANAVPCTNKATTYTDQTLSSACNTSTQLVLDGTTTCVALPDAQNNWGVWVPPIAAGYDYTIVLPGGVNRGPFNVLSQTNNLSGLAAVTNLTVTSNLTSGKVNNVINIDGTQFACSVAGVQSALTSALGTALSVTSASESGTTVTLVFSTSPSLPNGSVIYVTGIGVGYNGQYLLTSSAGNTVTYGTGTSGLGTITGQGTVYFQGGTVDARGCTPTAANGTISNSTGPIVIPPGVTLLLGPSTWTCTITTANTPCFVPGGNGAKIFGLGKGWTGSGADPPNGNAQGVTNIVCSACGTTTDAVWVVVWPTANRQNNLNLAWTWGNEVAGLWINMSGSGRDAIHTSSMMHGNVHDISGYRFAGGNPTSNGLHVEGDIPGSTAQAISYQSFYGRILMQPDPTNTTGAACYFDAQNGEIGQGNILDDFNCAGNGTAATGGGEAAIKVQAGSATNQSADNMTFRNGYAANPATGGAGSPGRSIEFICPGNYSAQTGGRCSNITIQNVLLEDTARTGGTALSCYSNLTTASGVGCANILLLNSGISGNFATQINLQNMGQWFEAVADSTNSLSGNHIHMSGSMIGNNASATLVDTVATSSANNDSLYAHRVTMGLSNAQTGVNIYDFATTGDTIVSNTGTIANHYEYFANGFFSSATNNYGFYESGGNPNFFGGAFQSNEAGTPPTGKVATAVFQADNTSHTVPINYNNGGITNFWPKTVALTADWTCGTGGTVASCTSATIIGSGGGVPLTFTLPPATNALTLQCDGVVTQATAVTANQWNLLTATNGATNVTANYSMATAATASAYGAVTDQASTTTTFQIAPSWTLGAITTKMPFHIWAKIEGASASGTVVSLQLLAPTVGDLVTIYRGTSCTIF